MEFSKNELLPILNSLVAQKRLNPKCIACGSEDVKFDPILFRLMEYSGKTVELLGRQRVFLLKTCQRCGHTEFLDALVLGLVDPKTGKKITEK